MASFIDDMRRRLLDSDEDKQLFETSEIEDELFAARITDAMAVKQFVQYNSYRGESLPFVVDSSTGKLTVTLKDLLGTKTEYLFSPAYAIHAYGRLVTVQDGEFGAEVESDDAYYDIDETRLLVTFDDALGETTPIVRIKGYLIDYDLALYRLMKRLRTKVTTMQDSRGQEVTHWLKRIDEECNRLQPATLLREGRRAY